MYFVFNVVAATIDDTGMVRLGAFGVYVTIMIAINIAIGIMDCGHPHIGYFIIIFLLCIHDCIIKSKCINLSLIFTSISTILSRILDIYKILTTYFVNCVVSLQNRSGSYCKFIYWCWFLFIHVLMTLLSIDQIELMFYNIIQLVKSKLICINNKQGSNKYPEGRNIQYHDNMQYALITVGVLVIYLFYTMIDQLSIEKQALIYVFNAVIIVFIVFPITSLYFRWNQCETVHNLIMMVNCMYLVFDVVCPIRSPGSVAMIHSDMVDIVIAIIHCGDLHIDYFMHLYTIYMYDRVVETIYIHFQAIFASNIIIFVQLLNIFINCIVIMIKLNNADYKSYYKFIYHYWSAFIHLIMIYLSIMVSELIIYESMQWIKPYFNNLYDNFDGIKSQNNQTCQSYGYMNCARINKYLFCMLIIIGTIEFAYQLINDVLFQQMTLLYYLMQIMIVFIGCSMILYYFNWYVYITHILYGFYHCNCYFIACQLVLYELILYIVLLHVIFEKIMAQ